MSSATMYPQRPTLPPLRSLDLPMHGVPSRMTLPGIHELCSQGGSDLVRLLYFRFNAAVVTDTVDSIIGSITSHRTLCLAMETSRICFFTNHLILPIHSASLIFLYIRATQLCAAPSPGAT